MRARGFRFGLLLALAALPAACAKREGPAAPVTIAVVPQGTTHEFWKSIHAGAVKAGRDLTAGGFPVEILWKGPVREDDRE
ncbi:hypothetical protein NL526_27750, partial [Klebsiella pneumoniae]|nr:hypothetical protein [Klebsiella pneumoniae]